MLGRARRTGRHFLPAAALAVLVTAGAATAATAPSTSTTTTPAQGRIAYVKGGAAWVDGWATTAPVRLPQSTGARFVTIAPANGAAVYGTVKPGSQTVRISRPPYRTSSTLALPPGNGSVTSAEWTRNANLLWLTFDSGTTASLDLKSTAFVVRPFLPGAVSADGRVRALTGTSDAELEDLSVDDGTPAPARAVFALRDRTRLFDALRAQRSPAVDAIVRDFDTESATDATQWRTGPPAVSPDGEALYWTSNLGSGAGAAGNTSWIVLKTDVKTGRTIGLGRFGVRQGRLPQLAVAPDGRSLLVTWSVHSSAVENPVTNVVLDLVSQKVTTLTFGDRRGWVSIQAGQCWSADARMVAVTRFAYDPATIDPSGDPAPEQFTLVLKEAATDRTVRAVPGAAGPSCG